MKHGFVYPVTLVLVACSPFSDAPVQSEPDPASLVATPEARSAPQNARTVEEFDTTTAAERDAAVASAAAGNETLLGSTIASLGDPSKGGFWLETPLVSQPRQGRVLYRESGKSVSLALVPTGGPETAGSRLSLAAMRLLGAPLTGLLNLTVYGN